MGIGGIMILFVILCAVSILGAVLLLLAKSERGKSIALYLLSIWGMAIAVISATSLPRNEVGQQILAWALDFWRWRRSSCTSGQDQRGCGTRPAV